MTVNDVDLVMQPTAATLGFTVQPSVANSRLTFQHFRNHDPLTTVIAPHNSDARQSASNDWPPPLIFDVAYGCAALKTWGVTTFMEFARSRTKHIYNNDEDDDGDENGPGPGRGKKPSQQVIDRDARAGKRGLRANNSKHHSRLGGPRQCRHDYVVMDI
jgi:hypothetical protein